MAENLRVFAMPSLKEKNKPVEWIKSAQYDLSAGGSDSVIPAQQPLALQQMHGCHKAQGTKVSCWC
jgi:hypothetical protein